MLLRMFDSLRTRMTLLTAVALIPAAALIAEDYRTGRQEVIRSATTDAERYRDALLAAHARLLESTRQLLAALARIPSVRELDSEKTSELLAALKAEHPIYLNLMADRPDGTVFASAEPLRQPVSVADTSWFRRARESRGFIVGEYMKGRITNKWVLTLGYPVRGEDGGLRAVVGAALPVEWFASALQSHALAPNASVCLFNDAGAVIAHFGPEDPEVHEHLRAAVREASAPAGTLWLGEGKAAWIYSYGYLVDTTAGERVYVAVGAPAGAPLARVDRVLRDDISKLLMVALFVIAGGWVASRFVIEQPVGRMLRATRRLAAGDLTARSGITAGPRELAELGRHFDAMAETIERRDAELRRYQEELEASAQENAVKRLEAEQRSEEAKRELHAILERVQDVIFRMDAQGRLVWATPSLETMSGFRMNEVLFRDVCTCMADPADHDRMLGQLASSDGRIRDFEVNLRRKDGTALVASINAQYVCDAEGRPVGVEGVARDISDQVRAREQLVTFNRRLEERVQERTSALERINAELEAFTYSVSHDLRAPLRSIEGFSKLVMMRHSALVPEEGRDYLGRVQRAARRMAQLIDDLLSLSHINRYALAPRSVDLSGLAHEIVDELRARDPDRDVEVRIEQGLIGYCDLRLSRIALANLLENAWKYTSRCATARIEFDSFRDRDGREVFRIRDNGVGFDMNYANKLFAPFQRLHSDEEFEGTGIGLATVLRVIQRHGGQIWAESEPGQGATFHFCMGGAEPAARAA